MGYLVNRAAYLMYERHRETQICAVPEWKCTQITHCTQSVKTYLFILFFPVLHVSVGLQKTFTKRLERFGKFQKVQERF